MEECIRTVTITNLSILIFVLKGETDRRLYNIANAEHVFAYPSFTFLMRFFISGQNWSKYLNYFTQQSLFISIYLYIIVIYRSIYQSVYISLWTVGWSCKIHQLLLYRSLWHPPQRSSKKTLNNRMVRFE